MKERPILFSTEMVQAVLDGRKTQTRRVVKNQDMFMVKDIGSVKLRPCEIKDHTQIDLKCPYGQVGDKLWVRETWWGKPAIPEKNPKIIYKADDPQAPLCWRPSIFMPKKYSRITLEITDIRVERVQDITYGDIFREGVNVKNYKEFDGADNQFAQCQFANEKFIELWDSINEKRGYSWNVNPWVWVVCFKVIKE